MAVPQAQGAPLDSADINEHPQSVGFDSWNNGGPPPALPDAFPTWHTLLGLGAGLTEMHDKPLPASMARGPLATPEDRRIAGLPPIPIHSHVGLEVLGFAAGSCDERLHVPQWMLTGDGRPTLGAVALVARPSVGRSRR